MNLDLLKRYQRQLPRYHQEQTSTYHYKEQQLIYTLLNAMLIKRLDHWEVNFLNVRIDGSEIPLVWQQCQFQVASIHATALLKHQLTGDRYYLLLSKPKGRMQYQLRNLEALAYQSNLHQSFPFHVIVIDLHEDTAKVVEYLLFMMDQLNGGFQYLTTASTSV